jgi:hypothetical protein
VRGARPLGAGGRIVAARELPARRGATFTLRFAAVRSTVRPAIRPAPEGALTARSRALLIARSGIGTLATVGIPPGLEVPAGLEIAAPPFRAGSEALAAAAFTAERRIAATGVPATAERRIAAIAFATLISSITTPLAITVVAPAATEIAATAEITAAGVPASPEAFAVRREPACSIAIAGIPPGEIATARRTAGSPFTARIIAGRSSLAMSPASPYSPGLFLIAMLLFF